MRTMRALWKDKNGYAVVEAAILFPIIIMIFASLVLLAIYLPSRAVLQRATQYAATAIATERSDTWVSFDPSGMRYGWLNSRSELDNVYTSLFRSVLNNGRRDEADEARQIVSNVERQGFFKPAGSLDVEFGVVNYVLYKEVVVTATRTIPSPVDLSLIGFPNEIPIRVTSTAVVQNGDEFVRNIDLAVDFVEYLDERYELSEVFRGVSELCNTFNEFLGI